MNLSIVILTCNQARTTLALLESLNPLMEKRCDIEVILVDNGSSDNTLLQVKTRTSSWGDRVILLRNDTNIGVAAGRNMGIKHASGNVIMLLDNDTIVSADAIQTLATYINDNPNVGIAAPALASADGHVQDSAKPYPGILLKLRHALGIKRLTSAETMNMTTPHPCYVIGACQVFRKSLVDEIGLLDEKIFYGPEDADFCLRASASGRTIDYLPHISIIHHWQRATRRNPVSKLAFIHLKALIYFYIKHRRLL